jgi:arsenate reductase
MIRQTGVEPKIIEYLKSPPSHAKLLELIKQWASKCATSCAREVRFITSLGLDNPDLTGDQLIDQMLVHPILINRPIIVTEKGVKLCRPSETVLPMLPNPNIGRFVKEGGEVIVG